MKGQLMGRLWCGEVLEMLSEYVDGDLESADRRQVERHLHGCRVCEQFGGEFTRLVRAIRDGLAEPTPLDADVEERLKSRLADACK